MKVEMGKDGNASRGFRNKLSIRVTLREESLGAPAVANLFGFAVGIAGKHEAIAVWLIQVNLFAVDAGM